jgi:ribosomal protein S18 acetylase RimI-like enzyme
MEDTYMLIKEKTITARDGKQYVIRSIQEKDAALSLNHKKCTSGESDFLVKYPEEWTATVEDEEARIKRELESPFDATVGVFDGDKIAGITHVGLQRQHIKLMHRASVGLSVRAEYQGIGLGSILMDEAIEFAREKGFLQLELGVYANNDKARSLYEKKDFKECGINPRAFRLKDGTMIDEVLMIKYLK